MQTFAAHIGKRLWELLRALRRRCWKLTRLGLVAVFILVFFQTCAPAPGNPYLEAAAHARNSLFDYVGWELDALANKAFESVFGIYGYLDEATRADVVRAYMADVGAMLRLEGEIGAIYADPAVADPAAVSANLRADRDAMRADLAQRQNMAEAILEEQVAAVLVDEGLHVLGQVLPPVAFRFTPLPDVLILSPRDDIRVSASLTLDGLAIDEREAVEAAVDADLNVASLVVDIGGMALYPAMVGETDWLTWAIETVAHEWVHHYLLFFPLGYNYLDGAQPETRAINETTADLLGKEIARQVFARYYPELVPPPPPDDPAPEETPEPPPEPAASAEAEAVAFNFATEMHETRVTVDDLLAAGEVEAAEAYMAERQTFFYDNGIVIRKLNQAFFAFYGGYQAEEDSFGAAGDDPIGPAVGDLRELSDSLADFLVAVRSITTTDELLAAVETARAIAATP